MDLAILEVVCTLTRYGVSIFPRPLSPTTRSWHKAIIHVSLCLSDRHDYDPPRDSSLGSRLLTAPTNFKIIFIFFGVITVGFSFVMWTYMPDSPAEAKFLDDHDKLVALERLRMNQMGVASGEWRHDHLKESFSDPKTYLWFALLFSISIPSGGIAAFGPLIIGAFGFDNFTAILMNIPFGAIQLTTTLGAALLAQRIKKKGPVIALLCAPPALGCVVLMATPHDSLHQVRLLTGYYLLAFFPGISKFLILPPSCYLYADT